MKYTDSIKKMLDSNITSYRIAKDNGLTAQYIDNYRKGSSKLENMALGKAEMLVEYYEGKLQEAYDELKYFLEEDIESPIETFDIQPLLEGETIQVDSKDGKVKVFVSLEKIEKYDLTDQFTIDLLDREVEIGYIGTTGWDIEHL